eukprot:1145147-Prymnesium_polylepis.1
MEVSHTRLTATAPAPVCRCALWQRSLHVPIEPADQTVRTTGSTCKGRNCPAHLLALTHLPVSYTHLTLPTICSV